MKAVKAMKKQEFLAEIAGRLTGLSGEDISRSLDFYSEMIDDRIEEGLCEEDAVAAVGSVEEIVSQIRATFPSPGVNPPPESPVNGAGNAQAGNTSAGHTPTENASNTSAGNTQAGTAPSGTAPSAEGNTAWQTPPPFFTPPYQAGTGGGNPLGGGIPNGGNVPPCGGTPYGGTPCGGTPYRQMPPKARRSWKGWEIALLILGSPLWLPLLLALLITVGSLLFALFVTLWSLVIAAFAVEISFAAAAIAGVIGFVMQLYVGQPAQAVLLLGTGLIFAGLSILLFWGVCQITKGAAFLCKWIFRMIKRCFTGKERA